MPASLASPSLVSRTAADPRVGPTKTVSLSPGQGDFLDLNGGTLLPPTGPNYPPHPVRVEVLPVVTITSPPAGGPSACLANAEIVDSFSGFSLVLTPSATAYPAQF